ncbi:MAG: thioredoxin family protein [Thermoplasmata archaeon]|nr:MAG: thioredoxin family protein [Thermoplasmata archaeon]
MKSNRNQITIFTVFSVLLIVISFVPSNIAAEEAGEIAWKSYQNGMADAEYNDKPVIIDFYTDWCTYCKVMDETTYKDERVINKSKLFVCIKVDGDTNKDLVEQYGVEAYPTTFFLMPDGAVISRLGGLVYADPFLAEMDKALTEFENAALGGVSSDDEDDGAVIGNLSTTNIVAITAFIIVVLVLAVLTIRKWRE